MKSKKHLMWTILTLLIVIIIGIKFNGLSGIVDPEASVLIGFIMLVLSTLFILLFSAILHFIFPEFHASSTLLFVIYWGIIGWLGFFQWCVFFPKLFHLIKKRFFK